MASTIQPTPIKHIYTIGESEYGQFCDIDDAGITIPSRIDKYRYQMTTIEESWSADSRDSFGDLYISNSLSLDKNGGDVSNTTQYYICNILVSSLLCSSIIVIKYYIM